MNEIRYDHYFNMNEWFIVMAVFVGTLMVLWLPRRFSKKTACVYLMCGAFCGFFFDHTLSVFPISFYVINDSSHFEVMDFFSHVMYAPYCFLFFYLFDLFRIKPRYALAYILVWAFISAGFERLSVHIGIFHYQNGYNIYYSFGIYLVVLSFWVIIYHVLKKKGDKRF